MNEKHQFIENMIEKVKNVPIESTIGRRLNLKKRGQHLLCKCPFHNAKDLGSFVVTPSKNMWYCFACGGEYGGSGIKFVMLYENKDFLDACFAIALEESIITIDEFQEYSNQDFSENYKQKLKKKAEKSNKTEIEKPKADSLLIHDVYSKMFSLCSLSEKHMQHLKEERILDEERIGRDYFSFPYRNKDHFLERLKAAGNYTDEFLMTVPGFYWDNKRKKLSFLSYKGIGILIRDQDQKIRAIQIRKDTVKESDSRYIWFSSTFAENDPKKYTGGSGCGAPLDILIPGVSNTKPVSDRKKILCITEGRFKAEKLLSHNCTVIGLQGVTTWKNIDKEIEKLNHVYPIQTCYLMFDSDMLGNKGVFNSCQSLYNVLQKKIPVRFVLWRKELGKGIDDLINNGNLAKVIYSDYDSLVHAHNSAIQICLDAYLLNDIKQISTLDEDIRMKFNSDLQTITQEFLHLPV